ncbi:MAG: hypothetical protein CSA21_00165 [Deltaproteobacteria bacterium]|nr:MAG: hypothetical protein CSA21_00165 [Deltaproteobacteria bacterium]
MEHLHREIQKYAIETLRPDGSSCLCLQYSSEQKIAEKYGCSLKSVEHAALSRNIIPKRYLRNQNTLSNKNQQCLLNSHVAVVGLGGLGGYVIECLARIGVGTLTLIDGDSVTESNLNRQLLSSIDNLGAMKAEIAAKRVRAINPAVETTVCKEFLTINNGKQLLESADLVIDCLDTIQTRFAVESAAKALNIPMVFSAISGTSGQVMVIFPEDEGLVRIYGEKNEAASTGEEATSGTLAFAAMATAAHECSEAITLLLQRPPALHKTLLFTDLADHSTEKITMD